jgi:chromosome segregation ATPase
LAKIDDIRCFAEDIAQWRVEGLTWAQIAAKLEDENILVSTDEIRSYWPRLAEGRNPAEYLFYWQSSQRNAELREAKRRAEVAEAETERLRQEAQAWERREEGLQAECDGLREQVRQVQTQLAASQGVQSDLERRLDESRQQERGLAEHVQRLRHQIDALTKWVGAAEALAVTHQRDATEANGRAQAASAEINRLRQQVSELERQLTEADARTAKAVAENEVYGNIRYYMGKSEEQAQLDEANKNLNGWIRFGESLSQAHQAGNKAEIARLLDRVAAWAASRGKV